MVLRRKRAEAALRVASRLHLPETDWAPACAAAQPLPCPESGLAARILVEACPALPSAAVPGKVRRRGLLARHSPLSFLATPKPAPAPASWRRPEAVPAPAKRHVGAGVPL